MAELLDQWATRLGLDPAERVRWRAAGWLHDALREADPAELRSLVPVALRALPDPLLHGPAAAALLGAEGIDDPPLLDAVAYHTLGHPNLDLLGRALFLADHLEPGRTFRPLWRASLRARLPDSFDAVLTEVLESRMIHLLTGRTALRPETVAFWNSLAREA